MTYPSFIKKFSDGDDNSYCWSTRLPKGGHQFLLDIQAEYQFPNKSKTLLFIVEYANGNLDVTAGQAGEPVSAKLQAKLNFDRAGREAMERREIIANLSQRLVEINAMDHLPTKLKLEATARDLAEKHQVSWPPPEMPLVEYDSEAKYVLDRVLSLLVRRQSSRLNLADLIANSVGDKDKILPVLERLEGNGYVMLVQERRSGPPTTWIEVPTLHFESESEVRRPKEQRKSQV